MKSSGFLCQKDMSVVRLHVHYSAFGHFFAKFSRLIWFIGPMLRVSRPLCLFGFRGIELVDIALDDELRSVQLRKGEVSVRRAEVQG
jgi:hypothetical protein